MSNHYAILCDLICKFLLGYEGAGNFEWDDFSRYMSPDGVDLTSVSMFFLLMISSIILFLFDFYVYN